MTTNTLKQFRTSLSGASPPKGLSQALTGLWHDGCGDWDRAHRVVQSGDSQEDAWVHAYLHRKEGDQSNAAYWYQRCNREPATGSLESEWNMIVHELLEKPAGDRAS
ncbi:MAG: hypothetical protein VYB37_02935 [Pseudomonadota bacterium]|nr:hypothetical protein [Pseudomonadota bacterium]